MNELMTKEDVEELIEVTIIELRGIAQPREVSELRELALDAREADAEDQLRAIARQVERLREFCEARKQSSSYTDILPQGRRRA